MKMKNEIKCYTNCCWRENCLFLIWGRCEYLADFHHDFIRVARGSSLHTPREAKGSRLHLVIIYVTTVKIHTPCLR